VLAVFTDQVTLLRNEFANRPIAKPKKVTASGASEEKEESQEDTFVRYVKGTLAFIKTKQELLTKVEKMAKEIKEKETNPASNSPLSIGARIKKKLKDAKQVLCIQDHQSLKELKETLHRAIRSMACMMNFHNFKELVEEEKQALEGLTDDDAKTFWLKYVADGIHKETCDLDTFTQVYMDSLKDFYGEISLDIQALATIMKTIVGTRFQMTSVTEHSSLFRYWHNVQHNYSSRM
jgi:sugar-specific transcriptional regulator TrmB